VSVIDESGRLLADGAEQDVVGGGAYDERKAAFERRLRSQVEAIVTSVVGPGRARVELSAEFDLNRITQTSDKYDPDSRVLRSSQTREEQSSSGVTNKDAPVSVSSELPGTGQKPNDAGSRDATKKSEEIVNYEISRVTKTEVTEAGRVNRISAAVLVDGTYSKNDKGEVTYTPRSKEELDRIASLVRTAIGFDAKRGDQVEVVNLRFAETPAIPVAEPAGWMSYLQFTKDDIMQAAEMGVMGLLGLIVLFTVVRPLVRRIVTPEGVDPRTAAALGGAAVAGAIGIAGPSEQPIGGITVSTPGDGSISAVGGANVSIVGGDEQVAISNRTSTMIDVAKVQGQVHAQSVQKVGELTEKNPHEAVSIIRSWLHEEAA
jgi:flagellar M-ring protein FliF